MLTPVRKTKKCANPKKRTYVVLKCIKISTKKPVTKQGKVITAKCGINSAARKYAMRVRRKTGRKVKSVYLYRKGKVTKFAITFKKSKKTGKLVASAKKIKSVMAKKSKKSKPCKKSMKKRTKRCPSGTRVSKNKKVCRKKKSVGDAFFTLPFINSS